MLFKKQHFSINKKDNLQFSEIKLYLLTIKFKLEKVHKTFITEQVKVLTTICSVYKKEFKVKTINSNSIISKQGAINYGVKKVFKAFKNSTQLIITKTTYLYFKTSKVVQVNSIKYRILNYNLT